MSFDIGATLRRLKPEKRFGPLIRRNDSELEFVTAPVGAGPALLLDTTVYIDTFQKRLPDEVKQLLAVRQANHSSIAIAELAHLFGRLDPGHPETAAAFRAVQQTIEAIPPHRLSAPSAQAMIEAGIVTGSLARLRGLPKADRQPLLNDAMLFLQALESGMCLLMRNIQDLDLVQQLVPSGRVVFYRQLP